MISTDQFPINKQQHLDILQNDLSILLVNLHSLHGCQFHEYVYKFQFFDVHLIYSHLVNKHQFGD